jgi:hypothetical protein
MHAARYSFMPLNVRHLSLFYASGPAGAALITVKQTIFSKKKKKKNEEGKAFDSPPSMIALWSATC